MNWLKLKFNQNFEISYKKFNKSKNNAIFYFKVIKIN